MTGEPAPRATHARGRPPWAGVEIQTIVSQTLIGIFLDAVDRHRRPDLFMRRKPDGWESISAERARVTIVTKRQDHESNTNYAQGGDRKSTRLNSSHLRQSRMPSSA